MITEQNWKGISTGAYTGNTVKADCHRNNHKSVSVINTDSANGFLYKIVAYFDKAELSKKTLRSENTLAATESYNYALDGMQVDHIKVFVKDAVANTHADWSVVFNLR